MKEQEYVITYKAAPQWILDTFRVLGGLCAVLIVATLILWGKPADGQAEVKALLSLFLACVCPIFMCMALMLQRNQIVLRKEGLIFPYHLMPSLLFRRKRTWNDIGAVMLTDSEGPDYFETGDLDNKELVLHFNSGGSAKLAMSALSVSELDKFFRASKQWGSTAVFAPELIELRRKTFSGPPQTKQIAFTALWEEELQQQFTATNYVPLDTGKQLQNGRFRIAGQIAAGGFAAIYLAERADKRTVVLKEAVLPPGSTDEARAKAKEMFGREAQFLLKLNHSRIARVYDHFVENGRDYLVLEYVPGQSLRQLVTRDGAQPEERVLDWAVEIADILDYLHQQEPPIIHRDVSPDNLLMREDGALVLIDFGAANEFLGTATGTLIGKQSYISPEQFRGKAEPASDIYGLGATLHYLLTGQEPEALSVSHPAAVLNTVSVQTDELIAQCTALEVSARIPSARELMKRLKETKAAPRSAVIKVGGGGAKQA